MKIIAVLLLVSSCSLEPVKRGRVTVSDRIEQCMTRLIEESGVKPEVAQRVCEDTFKNSVEPIGTKR